MPRGERMHPLEVVAPAGADDRKRYEKPRFSQFGAPARIVFTGKSGSGKSLAAMTLIENEYFDMCDRIILVSGSLKIDPGSAQGMQNSTRMTPEPN